MFKLVSRMSEFPIEIINIHGRLVGKEYEVAAHTHTGYQIYYVHQGKVNYSIDTEKIILEAGDCLLMAPGIIRSPKSASNELLYIATAFHLIDIKIPSFTWKQIKLPLNLQNEMKILIDESKKPDLIYPELYFKTILLRVTLSLLREVSQKNRGRQNTQHSNIVEAIEQYLLMNLDTPITREDVSQFTGYSTAQIARIFKSATGKTIGNRLTELRIQTAETYLRTSTISITEIALLVGFNSFSHFTQLFKSKTNLSPSDYRKKYSSIK